MIISIILVFLGIYLGGYISENFGSKGFIVFFATITIITFMLPSSLFNN